MKFYPVFLSIVIVVRNQSDLIERILCDATDCIENLVSDYELIVVDNASTDESLTTLENLTKVDGIANLQVYALTKEVDSDTASWAGLENALGDYGAVIDPMAEDIAFLPTMLDEAMKGQDVVFAQNERKTKQGFSYRIAYVVFNWLYRLFTGIYLQKEAPQYRLINKKVINFILQHSHPALAYRYLPATGGFVRRNLVYEATPRGIEKKRLGESIDHGLRILVSATRSPMRFVTALSLFGASVNILYSVYVIAIAIFKENVEPGWVSLSLQQSGMFFLISLVLLIIGEYLLQVTGGSSEGPGYYVGQEFTSARVKRFEKLNVEDSRTEALKETPAESP
jgi:glycosyltransferase involved in cell wall biosynthesis